MVFTFVIPRNLLALFLFCLFVSISDKLGSNAQAAGILMWNKILSEALCSCGFCKLAFREYAINLGICIPKPQAMGTHKAIGTNKAHRDH